MKKTGGWVALTVTAYLIALLAMLPARYAIDELAPQFGIELGSEWALGNISGTIWGGEVERLQYQGQEIGKASWDLHPLSLIVGNLALSLQLKSQEGEVHGEATFNPSGEILVEDIKGEVPVAELTALLPFVPVVVNGTLALDLQAVYLVGGKTRQVTGELHWNRAEIIAMQQVDFGDVTVTLDTKDDSGDIEAIISNLQGALAVNATATLRSSGEYQFAGELTTRSKKDSALLNNFVMIGRPDQRGRLRFNRSGRL